MLDSHDRTADLINQATAEVKERQKRLAEIEHTQATATPSRQKVSLAALVVAVPVFVVVVTVGFTNWSLAALFETRPSVGEARKQAEELLKGLVVEIEAFRHDHHELPERLIEIGIPARGEWRYSLRGMDQYRIEGTLYGQHVVFDSPKAPLTTAKD